jgi:hypothetical protein
MSRSRVRLCIGWSNSCRSIASAAVVLERIYRS